MKTIPRILVAVSVTSLALAGCVGCGSNSGDSKGGAKAGSNFKACAISDAGGWDDKSFNESAFQGLKSAEKNLGIKTNTAESNSDADFQPNVEAMVSDGCNLLIGVGFKLEQALHKSADANKDLHYALVDSGFTGPDSKPMTIANGRPLLFNAAEAAYLAGYVAAGMTKSNKVATFGGISLPSVNIFMDGFADGVAAYNQAHGTSVELLGWDKATQNGAFTNSFDDQALGKQQAQQFIDQGADIIMPVAGPVGLGAAAAAKADGDTYIIGVDSDWYEANPDYKEIILTSVKKEIGASVEQAIKDSVDGKFSSESYVGSLANGGVSIAPFHDFDSKVPQELKDEVTKLTEQIKKGELKVESKNTPN
ncbi:Purine nucleoside receptor A [Actinomyces bovis]|uniref:Purine nucleoside receptor A n=1 Tax=Actinomyces bovis TaxID=1658 RepID=A0ABY1VKU7_9ACTO|nr:BMP family ABC transporter substrate-binding protein [Actinomyces bovis]SPT52724.1 Purine nucleoside receptor A [Actinomyces bovis]VEG54692.1 Purine nucleoside receptor A [Actinomyces israelii]